MAKVGSVGGRWRGFVRSEMNVRFVTRLVNRKPIMGTVDFVQISCRRTHLNKYGFKEVNCTLKAPDVGLPWRDGPLPPLCVDRSFQGWDMGILGYFFQFNVL